MKNIHAPRLHSIPCSADLTLSPPPFSQPAHSRSIQQDLLKFKRNLFCGEKKRNNNMHAWTDETVCAPLQSNGFLHSPHISYLKFRPVSFFSFSPLSCRVLKYSSKIAHVQDNYHMSLSGSPSRLSGIAPDHAGFGDGYPTWKEFD